MNKPFGRALPIVAAIVAVAALVLGAGVLQGLSTARDTTRAEQAAQPTEDPTTGLDLGQVSDPEQVAACLAHGFASSPSSVEVLYGVDQRTVRGSTPVFVLRNDSGDLRLCDQFGADRPSQAPLPTVSDTRPVAFLSNGRSDWTCAGTSGVLDRFQMTTWLLVSPEVQTVQQRFWVDDVPGPWFTTRAQSGYAHLQSWLVGPEPAGTKYSVQYRVLDNTGAELAQKALPTERQSLPGCAGAGSAELG